MRYKFLGYDTYLPSRRGKAIQFEPNMIAFKSKFPNRYGHSITKNIDMVMNTFYN